MILEVEESRELYLKLQEAAREAQRREMERFEQEMALSEPHVFSDAFNQKMDQLLNEARPLPDARPKTYLKFINTAGRRAAVIIVAVITALAAAFSVRAVREPVIEFFITAYEKYSRIIFDPGETGVSFPDTIEEYYQPEYVPDGYTLIDNYSSTNVSEITYSNEKDYLIFEQFIISSAQLTVDTEGAEVEIFSVDGREVFFVKTNKGINGILWTDGSYGYQIMGAIGKEELIKMMKLTKK